VCEKFRTKLSVAQGFFQALRQGVELPPVSPSSSRRSKSPLDAGRTDQNLGKRPTASTRWLA
jgi:hypothetical protein